MKPIVYPFRAGSNSPCRLVVVLLSVFFIAAFAEASTRPEYGGTLRVQIDERVATIDPRQWLADSRLANAAGRVESLIFDHLVGFDDHGTIKPELAVSWEHDAQSKRWQFRLRKNVKF